MGLASLIMAAPGQATVTIGMQPGSSLEADVGHWISGAAHNGDSLTWTFSDSSGICTEQAYLFAQWAQDGTTVGEHLQANTWNLYGTDPNCDGPATLVFKPDLTAVPTGPYGLYATASDPAEQQALSSNTLTENILFIDNNTPTVSFAGPSQTAWYPGPQSVTVNASDGYEPETGTSGNSGIASLSCADAVNQTWPNPTPAVGDSAYFGTESQTVTLSGSGADTLYCTATNGVATTSGAQSFTVHIDPQTPLVGLSRTALAPKWVKSPPTVTATGSESQQLSGITSTDCSAHDASTRDDLRATATAAQTKIRLTPGGKWTLTCSATTGAGVSGSSTESVWVDDPKLDVPIKFDWAWKGARTTLKKVTAGRAPARTRWTATLDIPHHRPEHKLANTAKGLGSLLAWIRSIRYRHGEVLSIKLTRPGYRPEGARFTIRLHHLPAERG